MATWPAPVMGAKVQSGRMRATISAALKGTTASAVPCMRRVGAVIFMSIRSYFRGGVIRPKTERKAVNWVLGSQGIRQRSLAESRCSRRAAGEIAPLSVSRASASSIRRSGTPLRYTQAIRTRLRPGVM